MSSSKDRNSDTPLQKKRGYYFRNFRRERSLLKDLLTSQYPNKGGKKLYRWYRYLAYRLVPHLRFWLTWWKDRKALHKFELFLGEMLNIASPKNRYIYIGPFVPIT